MFHIRHGLAVLVMTLTAINVSHADLSSQLDAIRNVSREGRGNQVAAAAVRSLSSASGSDIPQILAAFEGASSLSANYLRNVVESVTDRSIDDGEIPVRQLEQFILTRSNDPRARRLAFEVLSRVDATAPDRLIPQMLLDPSPEFRRDAVKRLIAKASSLAKNAGKKAVPIYRKALSGATDSDLVKEISKALRDLGEDVNLVNHFGFLTEWRIIGPFDNREFVGFDTVYSPEQSIDFAAILKAKEADVTWQEVSTDNEFGIIDIAKSVAPHKGAVMYLATSYHSAAPRHIEFRFGTPNAWKLWINGKFLFGRDEYHRGMAIDQYRIPAQLKSGNNVILLKLCQNEQDQEWAQRYQIQLRVCDRSGIAVLPDKPDLKSTSDTGQRQRPLKKLTTRAEGASQ